LGAALIEQRKSELVAAVLAARAISTFTLRGDCVSAREDFFDAMRLAGDFTSAREGPNHVFDRHVLHHAGFTEPVRECAKHATSPQTFAE
jgi:hypothetical protein